MDYRLSSFSNLTNYFPTQFQIEPNVISIVFTEPVVGSYGHAHELLVSIEGREFLDNL